MLHDPPAGWTLEELPPAAELADAAAGADVVIAFFREAAELDARLPDLAESIFPPAALWIAWPRRAGGHPSDLTDTVIRDRALPLGIVDVKVAAIDGDWSGLRFVWRVTNRVQ